VLYRDFNVCDDDVWNDNQSTGKWQEDRRRSKVVEEGAKEDPFEKKVDANRMVTSATLILTAGGCANERVDWE
jgi:hypothetical protein